MTKKLTKTSVQLSPEILAWFDIWPGLTRSEAIRLALERTQYLSSQMKHVEELAEEFHPILTPALEEFQCVNFRTVARALPAIVGSYIQENDNGPWVHEYSKNNLETGELYKKLDAMHVAERIYLLDCIVARREWPKEPELVSRGEVSAE